MTCFNFVKFREKMNNDMYHNVDVMGKSQVEVKKLFVCDI